MERRLTAILAADVAGYSRMMEADETGTYEALKSALEEVVVPQIVGHGGQVVKLMGDGVLAQFSSVTDAVACSVALQNGMSRRADSEAPMKLRIGVHLGDVIVEGYDIHGEGVNVAARLESLAEPGTICLSQQVKDQIETRMDYPLRDLGPRKVKNIERPVHAYILDPMVSGPDTGIDAGRWSRRRVAWAVLLAAMIAAIGFALLRPGFAPTGQDVANMPAAAPERLSIAVLPFESLSEDSGKDYLADGLTDDLITDLAKLSGLMVIARNSSFAYKGKPTDVSTAAAELGVRYVVTGTLRVAGERLRINAQLIDTETGAHDWAERYDRETVDLLAVQDDVRSRIVAALEIQLTPEESRRLSQFPTDDPEAYDAYLRARQQESYFTRESVREARRLYARALEIDPEFNDATARLATILSVEVENGWVADVDETIERALSLARQAISRDDRSPLAYWALARIYTRAEFYDGEKAIEALEKAIEVDPNYATAYATLANALHFEGRAEEGLAHIETAMRLNPHFPFWYYFVLGANQFHLTRYEAARDSFVNALDRNSRWRATHMLLVPTYGHLGEIEEAEWEMEELRAIGTEPVLESWRKWERYQDDGYRDRVFEGLALAGVPER